MYGHVFRNMGWGGYNLGEKYRKRSRSDHRVLILLPLSHYIETLDLLNLLALKESNYNCLIKVTKDNSKHWNSNDKDRWKVSSSNESSFQLIVLKLLYF